MAIFIEKKGSVLECIYKDSDDIGINNAGWLSVSYFNVNFRPIATTPLVGCGYKAI